MTDKKLLVATYSTEDDARKTLDEMIEFGFDRSQIGYAVAEDEDEAEGEALLSVTVDNGDVEAAMEHLQRHGPVKIDEREAQWQAEAAEHSSGNPDADNYTAPGQKKEK